MHDCTTHLCQEITTACEFDSLREEWNALFAVCSYPSAFCTWEWAAEWWRHFAEGDASGCRLLVTRAYSAGGDLIGLAPFFFPDTPIGPLRLRPLRLLATRLRCTVDDMSEEPMILLHRDCTEEALRGVWQALSGWKERGRWDLVHLRVMRRADSPPLAAQWRRMPRTAPFALTRSYRRLGQTRSLPPTWAEFRKSLGKSMRDNAAYYPRLLTRDGHVWATRIVREPEEMRDAVPILVALHGQRAQSGRGPAHLDHLPGPAQQRFLSDILVRLAGLGQAALALLEVDGVPVAAQAVLEAAGRMTFYYSGFSPEWHRYSPVTVLHLALLQDAITRGLTGVDYLPESEPWKTRWGVEAEWVYDELSCLSVHPRALFRSLWRRVTLAQSQRRGWGCECGFCTAADQENGASV